MCLCMMRTLFAGSRQLLELRLFVDSEPANNDCCHVVPEHLRLRQEHLDLGFLAGVELLSLHEGQVLFDGAQRLVGGRETDVRRLWCSVAVGGGGSGGGFGHGFPYKTSFCDSPEGFRCWLDWPGRPKPSLRLPGDPLPFRSAPRITAVHPGKTTGALAMVGRTEYKDRVQGPSPTFDAPSSRLPVAASRPPGATPVTHNSPVATLSSVSELSSPAHTLPAKDRGTRILLQGTDPFAGQSSPHRTPRCRHPMRSGERSLLALRKATRAPTVRTRRPGRPELRTEQYPDVPPDSGVSKLPTLRRGHSPGADIVFSRP